MISNENLNPLPPTAGFHTTKWRFEDFFILLANGFLLIFLMICTGKLNFELWVESLSTNKNELWIAILLLFMAYVFSISFAKGSVRIFEKSGEVSNITQILRIFSIFVFFGFCTTYWIIIYKLAEGDYMFDPEYIQYILILSLCFVCFRYYVSIPNKHDILMMVRVFFVIIFVHASSIICQYIFLDAGDFKYFFQDFIVLIGMTSATAYTLFGRWKVQSN